MSFPQQVLPVLRSARELLLSGWGSAPVIGQKSADAASVVTEMDISVEKLVSGELKKLYPNIAFVGEETGGDRNASAHWLMDPIDGTGHYIRGTLFSTSMLALIEDGKVIFSAVYDFAADKMYWAELGKGAYCNDERIKVSNKGFGESYVSWETHLAKPENLKIFYALNEKTKLLNNVVAGWELAMVASGKLDARIAFDSFGSDYDFAPGSLLVSEAGGIVTNLGSASYDYRNTDFIAANPIIYKQLTEGPEAIFPILG